MKRKKRNARTETMAFNIFKWVVGNLISRWRTRTDPRVSGALALADLSTV